MAGIFELQDSLDQAKTMSVTVPTGGVTEGEVLTAGSVLGFVLATRIEASANTIESDSYTLIFQARKVSVNIASEAVTQGNSAYWDGTKVTEASTGNTLIGYFLEDAAATATSVTIDFDGRLNNVA